MEKTIKVTGKGKISVKPDVVRLIITQTSIENTYEGAIMESANQKENLNEAFAKLGFANDALKTLYFNVDTEYENYETKDKRWKSRLVGYKFTHKMKLEFPSDNKMLGRVLWAVSRCPGHPKFTIQHTISDLEAAKNELLANAVEDAKAKAEVLSKSAGVSLKDIITIDYSFGEIDIVSSPMDGYMLSACSIDSKESIDFDIEADDIDVTDTVTLVWEIS